MLLGCCHCGTEQSSSVPSSNPSSVASESSGFPSSGFQSSAASSASDSTGYPTIECLYCKDNIGPAGFQMEWTLENNCPVTGSLPTPGCYDQAVGPHYGITSSSSLTVGSLRCAIEPPTQTCFWTNNSTGEITVTFDGLTCGSCANGPSIVVTVSRYGSPGSYTYEMLCFVYFYYACAPGGRPPRPFQEGYVYLVYRKTSSLPLNCMGTNDLDLYCYDGYDAYTDPGGSTGWAGVGPGCNYASDLGGCSFPAIVTIKPDTGGGTFP